MAQHAVGRKSRRAEDAANILSWIAPDLSRAEEVATPRVPIGPVTTILWTRRPARMAQIRRGIYDFTWDYPRRAEIFALPHAGPILITRTCDALAPGS
jgi:hypothetical protein